MSGFILVPAGSEYQVYKKSSVNITSDTSEAPSDIVTHSADDGVHTVTDNSPVIANYESQSPYMEELSGLPPIVPVSSRSPDPTKNVGRKVETEKDQKPKWVFGSTDIRYD